MKFVRKMYWYITAALMALGAYRLAYTMWSVDPIITLFSLVCVAIAIVTALQTAIEDKP